MGKFGEKWPSVKSKSFNRGGGEKILGNEINAHNTKRGGKKKGGIMAGKKDLPRGGGNKGDCKNLTKYSSEDSAR